MEPTEMHGVGRFTGHRQPSAPCQGLLPAPPQQRAKLLPPVRKVTEWPQKEPWSQTEKKGKDLEMYVVAADPLVLRKHLMLCARSSERKLASAPMCGFCWGVSDRRPPAPALGDGCLLLCGPVQRSTRIEST